MPWKNGKYIAPGDDEPAQSGWNNGAYTVPGGFDEPAAAVVPATQAEVSNASVLALNKGPINRNAMTTVDYENMKNNVQPPATNTLQSALATAPLSNPFAKPVTPAAISQAPAPQTPTPTVTPSASVPLADQFAHMAKAIDDRMAVQRRNGVASLDYNIPAPLGGSYAGTLLNLQQQMKQAKDNGDIPTLNELLNEDMQTRLSISNLYGKLPTMTQGTPKKPTVMDKVKEFGFGAREAGANFMSGIEHATGMDSVGQMITGHDTKEMAQQYRTYVENHDDRTEPMSPADYFKYNTKQLVSESEQTDILREAGLSPEHLNKFGAGASKFAGDIVGMLAPLGVAGKGGALAARGVGALLKSAPTWLRTGISASVAGATTGGLYQGALETLQEGANPDEQSFLQHLGDTGETAAYFGAYGAASPIAEKLLHGIGSKLPEGIKNAGDALAGKAPILGAIGHGVAEGAVTGSIVGAGMAGGTLAATGDPQKALQKLTGEAGSEMQENFVEAIAFSIAKRFGYAGAPPDLHDSGPGLTPNHDPLVSIQNYVVNNLPDSMKDDYNQAITEARAQGLSDDEAHDVMIDALSQTDFGSKLIADGIQHVNKSFKTAAELMQETKALPDKESEGGADPYGVLSGYDSNFKTPSDAQNGPSQASEFSSSNVPTEAPAPQGAQEAAASEAVERPANFIPRSVTGSGQQLSYETKDRKDGRASKDYIVTSDEGHKVVISENILKDGSAAGYSTFVQENGKGKAKRNTNVKLPFNLSEIKNSKQLEAALNGQDYTVQDDNSEAIQKWWAGSSAGQRRKANDEWMKNTGSFNPTHLKGDVPVEIMDWNDEQYAFKAAVPDASRKRHPGGTAGKVSFRPIPEDMFPAEHDYESDAADRDQEVNKTIRKMANLRKKAGATKQDIAARRKEGTLAPLGEGSSATIKTERGTAVDVRYAIKDASNLLTSHHHTTGDETSAYPQELQPRDRSRAASEEQINRMLSGLQPEFLGRTPKSSDGAPVIADDETTVESGNGRIMMLQRGYSQKHKNIEAYKAWLRKNIASFGLKPSDLVGVTQPVLVRVRQTPMSMDERVKFAQESNAQATSALSATEQAKQDAGKLKGELLRYFNPGEDLNMMTAGNREFVRGFIKDVVGENERGRYITADGALNQEGVKRIVNAIFARVYGQSKALDLLAESTDNNVRNITNAMLLAAPRLLELKEKVESGTAYPLDITKDITSAVDKLSEIRENDQTVEFYLNQGDLFGEQLTDEAKNMLAMFDVNKRSQKKMQSVLSTYADVAIAAGDPNQESMFGDEIIPTKLEVLEAAIRRVTSEEGEQIALWQDPPASGKDAGKSGSEGGKKEETKQVIPNGTFIVHRNFTNQRGIYEDGKLIREDGTTEKVTQLAEPYFTQIKYPFSLTGDLSDMDAYDVTQEVVDAIMTHNPDLHDKIVNGDKVKAIGLFKEAVTDFGMSGDNVLVMGYYEGGPDKRTLLVIESPVTKMPIQISNFRDLIELHVRKTMPRPTKATEENTLQRGDRILVRNPETGEEETMTFEARPPGTTMAFVQNEKGQRGRINPDWIVSKVKAEPAADELPTRIEIDGNSYDVKGVEGDFIRVNSPIRGERLISRSLFSENGTGMVVKLHYASDSADMYAYWNGHEGRGLLLEEVTDPSEYPAGTDPYTLEPKDLKFRVTTEAGADAGEYISKDGVYAYGEALGIAQKLLQEKFKPAAAPEAPKLEAAPKPDHLQTQKEFIADEEAEFQRRRRLPENDMATVSGITRKKFSDKQWNRHQKRLDRVSPMAALDAINDAKTEHADLVRDAARSGELTREQYDDLHAATYGDYDTFTGPTPAEKAAKAKEKQAAVQAQIQKNIAEMVPGGRVVHGGFGQAGVVIKVNDKSFRVRVEDTGNEETWTKAMIIAATMPKVEESLTPAIEQAAPAETVRTVETDPKSSHTRAAERTADEMRASGIIPDKTFKKGEQVFFQENGEKKTGEVVESTSDGMTMVNVRLDGTNEQVQVDPNDLKFLPQTKFDRMTRFKRKMAAGDYTAADVKAQFESLAANKDELTKEIFDKISADDRYKRKQQKTRREMAERTYGDALTNLMYADSESFSMRLEFGGDAEASRLRQMREKVDAMTDESIQAHLQQKQAKRDAEKKAVENPETLAELREKQYKTGSLTVEEQRRFDELTADAIRERESLDAAKKAPAAATATAGDLTIKEGTHTKTGEKLWIVNPKERLSTEAFKELRTRLGKMGGHWSNFKPNVGFIFKSDPAEKLGGLTEEAADPIEAPADPGLNKTATKLRELADNMQERIDHLHGDRNTNTHRRASMAANAVKEGDELKKTQSIMRNLADAMDRGDVKHLDGITARTHIYLMERMLARRVSENMRRDGEQTLDRNGNHIRRDPKLEDIDGMELPKPTVSTERLTTYLDAIKAKKVPGAMRIAAKLDKLAHDAKKRGDYLVDLSRYTEEAAALIAATKDAGSVKIPRTIMDGRTYESTVDIGDEAEYMNDALQDTKRLAAMGIERDEQYRAALREFLTYQAGTGLSEAERKKREVAQRESEATRMNIDGFFPTPKALVDEMLDYADITPGMDVLEPSAGKGNIADAIKENEPGANLQVIEYSTALRGILQDKGHALLDEGDFLQSQPTPLFLFDRIIMNPPFENGQDIDHVLHAYKLLKPGGRIVAIVSEGPFYRKDKKAEAFREFVDEFGAVNNKNPEGAFKTAERSTGVATRMLVIEKPDADPAQNRMENDKAQVMNELATAANEKTWFHGTGTAGLKADMLFPFGTNHEGLFGQGIYLTDDPIIAESYANKRGKRSGTPTIYETKVDVAAVLDAEAPLNAMPDGVRDALIQSFNSLKDGEDYDFGALINKHYDNGASFETTFKAIKELVSDHSRDNEWGSDEYVDNFQELMTNLKLAGVDAFTHTGGLRAGKGERLHRVLILIDPNDMSETGRAGQVTKFEPYTGPADAPGEQGQRVVKILEKHGYTLDDVTGGKLDLARKALENANAYDRGDEKTKNTLRPVVEREIAEMAKQLQAASEGKTRTAMDQIAENVNKEKDQNGVGIIGSHLFTKKAPKPPKPKTSLGKTFQSSDAAIEANLQASHGQPREKFWTSKFPEKMRSLRNKLREFEHLPKTPENELLRQKLLQLMGQESMAQHETYQILLQNIVMKLNREQFELFTRKVLLDDMYQEHLKGNALGFGYNAKPKTFLRDKATLDKLVAADADVATALQNRKAAWDAVKDTYVKANAAIGFDVANTVSREDYFRHQILQTARERTAARDKELRTPTNRGFLKGRTGNYEGNYNTDYLQAEAEVMVQMIYDTEIARVIKMIDDNYNVIGKFKKEAKQTGQDWRTLVEKSGTHRIYQPIEGSVFFKLDLGAQATDMMNQVLQTLGATATPQQIKDLQDIAGQMTGKAVMAIGGKRRQLVLPNEVADTLDNLMRDPHKDSSFFKAMRPINSAIKRWMLVGPKNFIKYNLRNMTSDMEKTLAGNPKAFRFMARATKELYAVYYKESAGSPELREYIHRGGLQNLQQVQEMGDVSHLKMFMRFYDKDSNVARRAWDAYWMQTRRITDFREAVGRYANYLEYLEQITKNNGRPTNFGSSDRDRVMALKDPRDRAYKLANELLVDYAATSTLGRDVADVAYPFYRWIEGNIKSTSMLMWNAHKDGALAGAVGRKLLGAAAIKAPYYAVRIGKLALQMSVLTILLRMWNDWMFGDEENELPKDVQNKLHIIYGRDSSGKVLYLDRLGFMEDYFEWFGFSNADSDIRSILDGKATVEEVAKRDFFQIPVNKAFQGISPLVQGPTEAVTGMQMFPDAFNPSANHAWSDPLVDMFGLRNEVNLAKQQLGMAPKKPYNGWWVVGAASDPGEAAYYDVKDMVRTFKQRNNLSTGAAGEPTGRSNALYNYKLALRYGDEPSQDKYLDEYFLLGGTNKGLNTSLDALDPLSSLPKAYQGEFLAGLDDKDNELYDRAYNFYVDVLLGK